MAKSPRIWNRRSRKDALTHWLITLGVGAVILLCMRIISAQTEWDFVKNAHIQGQDLGMRLFLPQWWLDTPSLLQSGEFWGLFTEFMVARLSYGVSLWDPLVDTIHIATLGTIIGVVIATPLAFLAAQNTTPSRRLIRPVALMLLVASRSVNSLIWALLLIVILGPGVLAGIIAIALRSVGFCGKLLYEAIEEIDAGTVDAVRSTGASGWQVLVYGVAPQIAPAFAGISVYRWDINIREATILGLVGAGGIGMALTASIDNLAWGQVSVIFFVILGTVVISEWVSAKARAAVT